MMGGPAYLSEMVLMARMVTVGTSPESMLGQWLLGPAAKQWVCPRDSCLTVYPDGMGVEFDVELDWVALLLSNDGNQLRGRQDS